MVKTVRWKWLVALLALLLLAAFVGACGDDDETTTTPAAGEETTTTAAEVTTEETVPSEPVELRWYVGLGTGGNPEQIENQDAVVAAFNDLYGPDITLTLEIVENDVAYDTLRTEIAAGNAPDIVGPVGIRGANSFAGLWLDLDPLIESSGFDTSIWPEAMVDAFREVDGTLTSLPFASYPAMIFYNMDLFDEAGLPYPPADFGEQYGVGTEWEGDWDFDKLAEIAEILTVDAAGNDATSDAFDRTSTVQWGFVHQWTEDARAQGTVFGAGTFVADDGTAQIPTQWLAEWTWYHDAIWELGIAPSQEQQDSETLAGNAFSSGNIAMASTHLWYTCCITNDDGTGKEWWDLAPMPMYNGVVNSKLHADTLRIMNLTENPEAAFTALTYLVDDAALDLLAGTYTEGGGYGGMPADETKTDLFFAGLDATYPQGVNWQIAIDSMAYVDSPSHESNMPNFDEAQAVIDQFTSSINSDPAFDVDAAATQLAADLTVIFAEA
jgi:multiple sugar transport system substrate-binding protein